MLYYFINYNSLYKEIYRDIIIYCNKFEIDYNSQSIKNKRKLLFYYSFLRILKNIKKHKTEKPVILFNNDINSKSLNILLKKISKILHIPVFNKNSDSSSEGFQKELKIVADSFYEKQKINLKELKKIMIQYNLKEEFKEELNKLNFGKLLC
jgi:hypothetical protein